jgi:hypothetical protein
MAWIQKQPRLTQCYIYVACQLNDIGIRPAGAVIKPWIREEMEKYGIAADKAEIATVLAGLLAEKALTQQDVDTVNALRGT